MKKLLALCTVFFALHAANGQSRAKFISDSLDSYITRGMKDWDIPGLAIAIVKDGKVVFMKGYGVRDIFNDKTVAVDENTLFMIGSNTKAFTATALATLDVAKKLSFDDKVTKWIPYFKLNNTLAGKDATVRDLLCHRIGFETFQGDFTYWSSNLSRREVIEKMGHVKAVYNFRTQFGYCNAAFATAGEIIPAVTGQSWEAYVKETILKPLHMDRTLMLAKDLSGAQNYASPYAIEHDKLVALQIPLIDNLAPAGTMSSSVSDMTHWLIAQLDNGRYGGVQAISANAVQATHQPQTIVGFDGRDKVKTHFGMYGLGFFINDRVGKLNYNHTGGVDGFLSSLVLVPEEKLGIIVLTNTHSNNFFQDLTSEVRDSYLGLPYVGYSQLSLKRTRANEATEKKRLDSLNVIIAKKNKPSVELSKFTGVYYDSLYGEASVVNEKGKLKFHFSHHPVLIGSLELLEGSKFLCTYSIPTFGVTEIPFDIENGNVTGFTLTVADFVEFTPYKFRRR